MTEGKTYELSQHIGWLKQYVALMDETNWRDMRLRCERQLNEMSKLVEPHDRG